MGRSRPAPAPRAVFSATSVAAQPIPRRALAAKQAGAPGRPSRGAKAEESGSDVVDLPMKLVQSPKEGSSELSVMMVDHGCVIACLFQCFDPAGDVIDLTVKQGQKNLSLQFSGAVGGCAEVRGYGVFPSVHRVSTRGCRGIAGL